MKNLTFLLLTSLLLTGCSKILGGNGAKLTYTGTLYKDCNRTPFANAKIVYNTVRGSGLGSPKTGLSETYTDAAGKFTITEDASGLGTIRIELAIPPKYIDGPKIVQYDYTVDKRESETVDLGELFYAKRGVDVGGDADYGAKLRIKIDPYFQQFDTLIIGRLPNPLILSPVPQSFEYVFYYAGFEDFVSALAKTDGLISWCTSIADYNKRLSPPAGANIFERRVTYTLCNQGLPIEFSIDTFARAKR